jgi:peptide methionine sulfoxide reductase MsrA
MPNTGGARGFSTFLNTWWPPTGKKKTLFPKYGHPQLSWSPAAIMSRQIITALLAGLLSAASLAKRNEVVYLSLGCFWDKEFRIECAKLPSVDPLGTLDMGCNTTHNSVNDKKCVPGCTVVGYMGGTGDYPSYSTNYTALNYSETVRLVFDPEELAFEKIMDEYWKLAPDAIDPQSSKWKAYLISAYSDDCISDPAYFLRIFTTTDAQLSLAKASMQNQLVLQNTSKLYVQIEAATDYEFWKAEE